MCYAHICYLLYYCLLCSLLRVVSLISLNYNLSKYNIELLHCIIFANQKNKFLLFVIGLKKDQDVAAKALRFEIKYVDKDAYEVLKCYSLLKSRTLGYYAITNCRCISSNSVIFILNKARSK